jgi:hypothetical protein
LFDATGANIANTVTDSSGRYTFSGLADGTYDVGYDTAEWWNIRATLVPTTTGGRLTPRMTATLSSTSPTATVDFGWRQIVRSTTAGSPITSFVATNGLRVESYDDVVPAADVYAALQRGALIGDEASKVTVVFDLGNSATTAWGAGKDSSGTYTTYSATSYMNYVSWLDTADKVLFHEYGHAWSGYYANLAQQDPTFGGYLRARGLAGDSRINTAYKWDPAEMIAEDYRQLFGSPEAAAYPQMNQEIPAAANVVGLRDYLGTTFRQPVAAPQPAPVPAPKVTGLAMNPSPVKTTGTASFSLSVNATITLDILDSKGQLVRRLLSSSAQPAGSVASAWDRKTSTGQKAARGTYTLTVRAVSAGGEATASIPFSAS